MIINKVIQEIMFLQFFRKIEFCKVNVSSLNCANCSVKSLEQNEQKGSTKIANAIEGVERQA